MAATTQVRLLVRTLDGSLYMPALSTHEVMHLLSTHNQMTPVGLEPTIPGSVGQCLIHWATGPSSFLTTLQSKNLLTYYFLISCSSCTSIPAAISLYLSLRAMCFYTKPPMGIDGAHALPTELKRPLLSACRSTHPSHLADMFEALVKATAGTHGLVAMTSA